MQHSDGHAVIDGASSVRSILLRGRFHDTAPSRYDRPMSNFVFTSTVRPSIRSELRAFVLRTGAVYVDLCDHSNTEEPVVVRAGALVREPTDEQSAYLQSYTVDVVEDVELWAWFTRGSSTASARHELKACGNRLCPVAERAWLERRIWLGLAAAWRFDDVGPRSDSEFAQMRLLPWRRLADSFSRRSEAVG